MSATNNVSGQIGNRMSDVCESRTVSQVLFYGKPITYWLTIVGHGQDGDLSDRSVPALDPSSSLVDGRQIGIQVTRVTSTTGHFLSSGRDLKIATNETKTRYSGPSAKVLTSRKASA